MLLTFCLLLLPLWESVIVLFCCTLLYVHSSIAIILMGKRELVVLLNLSSWCLVMVEWLFLAVPWGCLRPVLVVYLIILLTIYKKSGRVILLWAYLSVRLCVCVCLLHKLSFSFEIS